MGFFLRNGTKRPPAPWPGKPAALEFELRCVLRPMIECLGRACVLAIFGLFSGGVWPLGDLAQAQMVGLRFDITDLAGTSIDTVEVGDEFNLDVYVQDVRPPSVSNRGVFSAFLDVHFDGSLVTPLGTVTFGDHYRLIPNPVIQIVPGTIQNIRNTDTNLGLSGPLGHGDEES